MSWTIRFHELFEAEFDELGSEVQDELLTQLHWLQEFGPVLGRPRVDTLKGSTHANMKELRFDAEGGIWRVAFAFDPKREAILLVAGDKSGGSQWRFYKRLIAQADERFDEHLAALRRQQWQGV